MLKGEDVGIRMTMKPDVGKAWDGVGGVSRLLSLRRSSWPIRERRGCPPRRETSLA